jgi:predicted lipoprotein
MAAAYEFLDSYQLSSLTRALRADKKLTVGKIDSAMEEAISTLKASKSPAESKIAESKYAKIKDLINQYQRMLGKVSRA